MNKKNIRLLLFIWDISAIILISFSVIMMFEVFIKKILIDSNLKEYYEIIYDVQNEYKNASEYLKTKSDLPYKESMIEIIKYLKMTALQKSRFENSLTMIINQDTILENTAGYRNNSNLNLIKDAADYKKFYLSAAKIPDKISIKDYNSMKNKLDKNDQKVLDYYYKTDDRSKFFTLQNYPDKDGSEKLNRLMTAGHYDNYIKFVFSGKKYIGAAAFLSDGINKNLDKNNIEKFYPVIVVADLEKDFFYLIDRIRNIFFLILGIIFITVTIVKLYNTFVITKEIKQITTTIKNERSSIEEKGEIGTALKEFNLYFKETSSLYDSYSALNTKLSELGDIISGIADKELFVATLKNDKSILDPHEVNMAVMFLDVKGFTTIAETYKEKSMSIINFIWSSIESVIYKYDGKINKYIGDAALIIFSEKKSCNNPARNAIWSALSILESVNSIKEELKVDFNFRIGIDYGTVVYGKTGSTKNFELGVIGDTVNTASRFEGLNKQYNTNVLLSGNALKNGEFLPDKIYESAVDTVKECSFFLVDSARPHGKNEVNDIYTIIINKDDSRRFLGSEVLFQQEAFDYHSKFLKDFFSHIKYWQDNKKSEGTKKWIAMAKMAGKFFYEKSFPVTEIFLNRLLKYEELQKYQNDPVSWLKQDEVQIKVPDPDWIKFGTIELAK